MVPRALAGHRTQQRLQAPLELLADRQRGAQVHPHAWVQGVCPVGGEPDGQQEVGGYDAMAGAMDPKLVKKALLIALTDELPTSRAVFLVSRVARESGHPDIAWDFARANMKALLAKIDALGANTYAPSLFTFFSDGSRTQELRTYAKSNLSAASAREVAKALDEIQFRSEFKKRLALQLSAWINGKNLAGRQESLTHH